MASIDHVYDMLASIELDGDPAKSEQVASILRAMPEFAEVMVYDDSVIGRFTDGEILVVFNNRGLGDNPDGGTLRNINPPIGISKDSRSERAKPRDASAALNGVTRLPESSSAILINVMGNAYIDSTKDLDEWFSAVGYSVTKLDGTIESLRKNVVDVGALYMSTHGAEIPDNLITFPGANITFPEDEDIPVPPPTVPFPGSDGKHHFTFCTRTPITNETINQYREDVRNGDLYYGIVQGDRVNGKIIDHRLFTITEAFVRKHCKCKPGALIYMDACSSASKRMADVCLGSVGASVYVGWTRRVLDRYSTPSARYFFDRALGTNIEEPVSIPPQRPFSVNTVLGAMHGLFRLFLPLDTSVAPKGLYHPDYVPDPNDPDFSRLIALYAPGTNDVVLRPGIESLKTFDLQDKLTIDGNFGDEPGTVTIDGTPLSVSNWTSDLIECGLSKGAHGAVVVETAARESNPRRLTQWNLTLRRTFMDYPTQGGINCPSCFYDATLHYTFRADIGDVRLGPEENVSPPGYTGGPSEGDIEVTNAGGSYSIGQGSTITLAPNADDGAEFIGTCVGFLPPADNNYFGGCFFLDVTQNSIAFSPTIFAEGLLRNYTGGPFDGTSDPYQVVYNGNGNELILKYSPNFTIEAGNKTTGANSYFEWDSADAHSPAEPNDPK